MSERLNAFSVKTCCEDKDTIDGLVRSYLIFCFFITLHTETKNKTWNEIENWQTNLEIKIEDPQSEKNKDFF